MANKQTEPPGIAERVKFWEEQRVINDELIPRVLRQHKLMTGHIRDHENLQTTATAMIQEAREEQRQLYEDALASAKLQLQALTDATIDEARSEQKSRYDQELASARHGLERMTRDESLRIESEQKALYAALKESTASGVKRMQTRLLAAMAGATLIIVATVALVGLLA